MMKPAALRIEDVMIAAVCVREADRVLSEV
jgi:hypothetical protein